MSKYRMSRLLAALPLAFAVTAAPAQAGAVADF